jgi:phospholipid/cholesterol/gamma-HCH transport system substrate-binding protein
VTRALAARGTALRIGGAVVGLALVAGLLLNLDRDEPLRVSAMFNDTTGLYVGNDVRVLGVDVGEVKAVRPSGRSVRVDMEFPEGTEIPANAQAAIMQSSLVTDRFVELTPAYRQGEQIRSGTVLPLSRTRNPANLDEMVRAVDELIVALGDPRTGGSDVGQLLDVGARNLSGQGRFIQEALKSAQGAMDAIDGNEADLEAITTNLDSLVGALAKRDALIRRLSTNVTQSTSMLAGQRVQLRQLVGELAELVGTVTTFVRRNRGDLKTTLTRSRSVLSTLAANHKDMADTLDLLPLVGQNIWRAYDPKTKRLRIRIDMRNTGPLSATARSQLCRAYGLPNCDQLTNPDETGALDPIFRMLSDQFPSGLPGVTP